MSEIPITPPALIEVMRAAPRSASEAAKEIHKKLEYLTMSHASRFTSRQLMAALLANDGGVQSALLSADNVEDFQHSLSNAVEKLVELCSQTPVQQTLKEVFDEITGTDVRF